MIPIGDDNPTLRPPVVTYALLAALGAVWVLVQGAGLSLQALTSSVCQWGIIPANLLQRGAAELTFSDGGLACAGQERSLAWATLLTHMFLHGSWSHLLGNALFLWVFGNNIEDSMGRIRFVVFYAVCGLAAAGAQLLVSGASSTPMVGASGAISGVMGAYLVLYPQVRVRMLFIFIVFIRIIPLPAWVVLLWWFGIQLLSGLPQLGGLEPSAGVAFFAHVGGFVAGVALIKLFENNSRVDERTRLRHRFHPGAP